MNTSRTKRPTVHDDLLAEWGANITLGRKAAGYPNQRALAEALGVTQATVCRWERGRNAPTDADKVRLAELLHQEVRALFPLTRGTVILGTPEAAA